MTRIYPLAKPSDADPFVSRLTRVINRQMSMTVEYTEQLKLPNGQRSLTRFETVLRTIEPYRIDVTQDGTPIVRAFDRKDGTPKTWRMDRIKHYAVHRTTRTLGVKPDVR